MRHTIVFFVAALTVSVASASAAPAHPRAREFARADSPGAATLAGKRIAWQDTQLFWRSRRSRPQRIAKLPYSNEYDSQLTSLAGSSRLLAWEFTVDEGDRLSYEESSSYFVRRAGRNKRVAACSSYDYDDVTGVDVSGSAVAIGCGKGKAQIRVLDYSRGAKPKTRFVTGHFPAGPVQIAGRYLAWREFEFFLDRIVVWDWKAGREAYRFYPPAEVGLNFDLQSDGKVALTYMPDQSKSVVTVAWFSPQEPVAHTVATDGDFAEIFVGAGRIAYTQARPHQFVVVGLDGSTIASVGAPALYSSLEDFDGRCMVWIDYKRQKRKKLRRRVMVAAIPGQPRSAC